MKKLIFILLITCFCATTTEAMPQFSFMLRKLGHKIEQSKRTRQFKKRKKQNTRRQHVQMRGKVKGHR